MYGDAHIVNHVNDVFDLFRVDDVIWQMIIDLRVGQVPLFLAAGNQFFQLLSLFAPADYCFFFCQDKTPTGKRYKRLMLLFRNSSIYNYFYQLRPS